MILKKKRRHGNRKRRKKEKVYIEPARRHVICGTDCETPCLKDVEDEGRDWRKHQDWPWAPVHHHTALCDTNCKD